MFQQVGRRILVGFSVISSAGIQSRFLAQKNRKFGWLWNVTFRSNSSKCKGRTSSSGHPTWNGWTNVIQRARYVSCRILLAEQTWGGMVAARLGCFLALREPPNPTVATGCFLGPARTTKPCKLRYKTASTSQIPRKLQCSAPFGGVLGPFWGRSGGLSVRFWVVLS